MAKERHTLENKYKHRVYTLANGAQDMLNLGYLKKLFSYPSTITIKVII